MRRILSWVFALSLLTVGLNAINIRPVPWITEGAIAFLEEHLKENPNATILEFGSGASTLWFAQKTPNLHSVEHHPQWFNSIKRVIMRSQKFHAANLLLLERPYYTVCEDYPDEYFDLILVDGRNRKGCIFHAISKLKKGGILMLDNSERRHYHDVFYLMDGWERYDDVQMGPDTCGFCYPNWTTTYWIKPSE